MGGAIDGVAAGRGHLFRRALEAISEIWRERASEKRARPPSKVEEEPRVPRPRIRAVIEARLAVRSGVRLDDFLRHRLAAYAGRLPIPLESLPVTVDIEGGEAVVRPRPRGRPPLGGERTDAPAFAQALVERDGLYAAREIRDAEEALDDLDARAVAARARLEALELDLGRALAAGELVARPHLDATPEQLGRPPVPPAVPIHAIRLFVAVLVAAEAWRLSGPVLAASGLAADGIERALRTSPVPAALALAFALGTAAAAFAFAATSLARAADAVGGAAEPGRRRLLAVAAAAAALLVPGVAATTAAPDRWAQLALLAFVPFAGAMLWRAASGLEARRGVAAQAALAWDRERAREAIARGRREEACARAAAGLQAIEAERGAARRKLQKLHRLAIAAQRSAGLADRAEARSLDRLSEGLACALELDRYLYLRLSAALDRVAVERPVRTPRLERAVGTEHLGVAG